MLITVSELRIRGGAGGGRMSRVFKTIVS